MQRSYYELLQVSADADPEIIKVAFRTIMTRLKGHPDHGGDEEAAKQLIEAYDVLSNPNSRLDYDRQLFKSRSRNKTIRIPIPTPISQEEHTPTLRANRIMARVRGQPIVVRSPNGDSAKGALKDMSESGARVATNLVVAAGQRVELFVRQEPFPFAIGSVVRVVKKGEEFGVTWMKLHEENLGKGVLWDVKL
jgi:DnaJ-class molecular chaperone